MARPNVAELLQEPVEEHMIDVLYTLLQYAVDLELATLPAYLSGMWSIKDEGGPVYNLIDSVVREEMLHLGLAANILTAIGGTPKMNAPTYPGNLPGGVLPPLTVELSGLTQSSVAMYMKIELPETPPPPSEWQPTIGQLYDAILAWFTALNPPLCATNQVTRSIDVPDPDQPGGDGTITESLKLLTTPDDVVAAINTIKEQGEGTSSGPDAPQYDAPEGELAHYYRFGEIANGRQYVEVDGVWGYTGDAVPFPACYPVAPIPAGGYPGALHMGDFDLQYVTLLTQLEEAWSGSGSGSLDAAICTMGNLTTLAGKIVATALPDGSGNNYGPDFVPDNAS